MTARVVPSWSMVCDSCGVMIRGVDTKKFARFFMREHNKAMHSNTTLDMGPGKPETTGSVSQRVTEVLGTDDWVIVRSGDGLVTDVELDQLEAQR